MSPSHKMKTNLIPKQLTDVQRQFLTRMVVLLGIQFIVLFLTVILVNILSPQKICLFTCRQWLDFLLFLLLVFILFFLINNTRISFPLRFLCFLSLGILLGLIIAVEYNLLMMKASSEKEKKKVKNTFGLAFLFTLLIFILALFVVPYLLPYHTLFENLTMVLFFTLCGLILWGLLGFSGLSGLSKFQHRKKYFTIYLYISLTIFVLLLFTEITTITYQCKTPGSYPCDSLVGSTLLYTNLINILQKVFLLQNY